MRRLLFTAAVAALVSACGPSQAAPGAPVETRPANAPNLKPAFENQTRAPEMKAGVEYEVKTVAEGLANPWAIAFLPDGKMLVSEKPGRLRIVGADGALSEPVAGLPAVYAKGQGTGPKGEVGQELYMRGLLSAMLGVEGVRKAQERFGKGKVMTGEQVRWGLENLNLDQKTLDSMGFAGVMRPVQTSCLDHMGSSWVRVHTWNGSKWEFSSDWYQADEKVIRPMVMLASSKYAEEKKLKPRTPEECKK